MANEATVQASLRIRKGHIDHKSFPSQFRATVDGTKGPSPGAVTISTEGTDVLFGELTTPGLATIQNIDTTNYVEYGIVDPVTRTFYPLGEILPGEIYPIRFSRNLREAYYPSTGTGTTGEVNALHFKANTADVIVVVNAFEK